MQQRDGAVKIGCDRWRTRGGEVHATKAFRAAMRVAALCVQTNRAQQNEKAKRSKGVRIIRHSLFGRDANVSEAGAKCKAARTRHLVRDHRLKGIEEALSRNYGGAVCRPSYE